MPEAMQWKSFLESSLQPADPAQSPTWVQFLADLPAEPCVLWYPSAGDDFNDLRFLTASAESAFFNAANPVALDGQYEAVQNSEVPSGWATYPDVYVHSDVLPASSWDPLETPDELGHSVILAERVPLTVASGIPWEASPRFVHVAPKSPPPDRTFAELLLLRPSQPNGGYSLQPQPVLYFYMENFNYLRDVLLAYGLPAHWIVEVGYGEREGGAATPPSYLQLVFGYLQTRYLVAQARYLDRTEAARYETRRFLSKFLKWRPEMWDYFRSPQNAAVSAHGMGHIDGVLWNEEAEPIHLLKLEPKAAATEDAGESAEERG
jgi:hypothetical protein